MKSPPGPPLKLKKLRPRKPLKCSRPQVYYCLWSPRSVALKLWPLDSEGCPKPFHSGSRGQEYLYNNTKTFLQYSLLTFARMMQKQKWIKLLGPSHKSMKSYPLSPCTYDVTKSPASHNNVYDGVIIVNFIKTWPWSTHLVNNLCINHFCCILNRHIYKSVCIES